MSIEIKRLTPLFAAEIRGLDIAAGVDDETFEAVRQALEDYSVLVFPEQPVTADEQIAFSARFGELEDTIADAGGAGTKIARITNLEEDMTFRNAEEARMKFNRANELWHSDSSFKRVPAMASMLAAYIVPPEGGDTEFACGWAAYGDLPAAEKAQLEGKVAIHDIRQSRSFIAKGTVSDKQKKTLPPVQQCMVRINRLSGRKSIYVGSHIAGILGMAEADALAWNRKLIEHVTQAKYRYRHKWSPGDIVMWDNRCVLHRGYAYDYAAHKRLLHRMTISASGPTAADGQIIDAAA